MSGLLELHGGKKLHGEVNISGFKHSTVPILTSCLLLDAKVKLTNVPDIKDTRILSFIVEKFFNMAVRRGKNSLTLDARRSYRKDEMQSALSSKIHGSTYLIPAAAIRFGEADLCKTGGCKIDKNKTRSIDHILQVMKLFGAKIDSRKVIFNKVNARTVDLAIFDAFRRSGVTKTSIMCGISAKGKTKIRNYYRAQEVIDLLEFLKKAGFKIHYDKKDITIDTTEASTQDVEYRISDDLLEIVTFVLISAITKSGFRIKSDFKKIEYGLNSELKYFNKMGINFQKEENSFCVIPPRNIRPINAVFEPYPSAYSDSQPLIAAALSFARGRSVLSDKVWSYRYGYMRGFNKLGVDSKIVDGSIVINGIKGTENDNVVCATDLRSAAALIMVALGIDGKNYIVDYDHVDRGYENFTSKLRKLGAEIRGLA